MVFDPLDSRVLAFYAERQAFTEIMGCQEVGMKGGLDR